MVKADARFVQRKREKGGEGLKSPSAGISMLGSRSAVRGVYTGSGVLGFIPSGSRPRARTPTPHGFSPLFRAHTQGSSFFYARITITLTVSPLSPHQRRSPLCFSLARANKAHESCTCLWIIFQLLCLLCRSLSMFD